jgi:hypothetical protein
VEGGPRRAGVVSGVRSRGPVRTRLTCPWPLVAASANRAGLSRGPAAIGGSTWAVPDGRIRLLDRVCGAMAAEVLGSDDAVFGSGGCGGPTAVAHAL